MRKDCANRAALLAAQLLEQHLASLKIPIANI
jgi:hypothetical protein